MCILNANAVSYIMLYRLALIFDRQTTDPLLSHLIPLGTDAAAFDRFKL